MCFNTEKPFSISTLLFARLFGVTRFFLRLLPSEQMLALGSWVGQRIGARLSRDSRIAHAQLLHAFPQGDPRELSDAPQDIVRSHSALIEDMYGHFGESSAELLILDRYLSTTKPQSPTPTIRSIGDEKVQEQLSLGRGAIALSGHLGCFELLAAFEAHRGMKLSVVARQPRSPFAAALLQALRERNNVKTLWREDPRAMRKIMHAVGNAEVVAALIDQDVQLDNEFAEFFGLAAAYPRALVSLAIARQIPLFSSFIYRESRMRHVVVTEQIEYDAEDRGASEKIFSTYSARLEALLREYPEQWPWWHRRWRRRPDIDYKKQPEALLSTDDYLSWLQTQSR